MTVQWQRSQMVSYDSLRCAAESQVSRPSSKVRKTVRYYSQQAVRAARRAWYDVSRLTIEKPIFIIGCSRAGTTVVYKTFSESEELGTLNRETHDFWAALHPLADKRWRTHALTASDANQRDRDVVSRYFFSHTGKRRIVDKNNQNGLCVPYLYALFPDAYFVYVKRSPGDNLHSLIEGWAKAEEFATWSNDIPAKVAIEEGRYTRWCFFLADGWEEYLDARIEDVCAFQYNAVNQAILDARKAIPASQWSEIFYEDVVRDPVDGFRKAFLSSGLAFTPQLERYCAQVLETPFNAFSAIRLDKWRSQRNSARIERVMPSVIETARRMGYED
jgi:hypothetical protein